MVTLTEGEKVGKDFAGPYDLLWYQYDKENIADAANPSVGAKISAWDMPGSFKTWGPLCPGGAALSFTNPVTNKLICLLRWKDWESIRGAKSSVCGTQIWPWTHFFYGLEKLHGDVIRGSNCSEFGGPNGSK